MQRITVKTFDDAISAHLWRVKLESEGIPCFIRDEHIVTMDPLINFAVGGVKLQVYEDDFEKARNVIEEMTRQPLVNFDNELISCPNCLSTDLYKDFKSMKGVKGLASAFVSLFLMVFPIYFKRVYKCKACSTEFQS